MSITGAGPLVRPPVTEARVNNSSPFPLSHSSPPGFRCLVHAESFFWSSVNNILMLSCRTGPIDWCQYFPSRWITTRFKTFPTNNINNIPAAAVPCLVPTSSSSSSSSSSVSYFFSIFSFLSASTGVKYTLRISCFMTSQDQSGPVGSTWMKHALLDTFWYDHFPSRDTFFLLLLLLHFESLWNGNSFQEFQTREERIQINRFSDPADPIGDELPTKRQQSANKAPPPNRPFNWMLGTSLGSFQRWILPISPVRSIPPSRQARSEFICNPPPPRLKKEKQPMTHHFDQFQCQFDPKRK